eukprot:3187122-Pyramimonas_sp.AAC.1
MSLDLRLIAAMTLAHVTPRPPTGDRGREGARGKQKSMLFSSHRGRAPKSDGCEGGPLPPRSPPAPAEARSVGQPAARPRV